MKDADRKLDEIEEKLESVSQTVSSIRSYIIVAALLFFIFKIVLPTVGDIASDLYLFIHGRP